MTKTIRFIKVTVDEPFPRVMMVRRMAKDKAKYFGPYTSAGAVKDTIELIPETLSDPQLQPQATPGYRKGTSLPELSHSPVQGALPGIYFRRRVPVSQSSRVLRFLNGN